MGKYGRTKQEAAAGVYVDTSQSHKIRFRKLIEWMPKALEVRREHCGSL